MQIADVERLEPSGDGLGQLEGAGPLAQPETLLLERADAAFGVGVALRVVVARERLGDAELATGAHERNRSGLATVVRHQVQRVATDPLRGTGD